MRARGRLVWITGLAGSGKTTIATALAARLRRAGVAVVVLDGDELRRTIAPDLGYALGDRRVAAERYARLARALAAQPLTVIVATISGFEAVRRANRRRVPRYCEVYLRGAAPGPVPRGRHRASPSVGVDLPFETPALADLVFDDPLADVEAVVGRIERRLRRGH